MPTANMNLKVLLPFSVFAELNDVSRIVAETSQGSFGLLPHRMDCVAALAPGILVYETETTGETYLAVDEGILIKSGLDVVVSVRNAIEGTDLDVLEEAVEREFIDLNEKDLKIRSVLAKMEGAFFIRMAEYGHD